MAVIKYKDSQSGQFVALTNYIVQPITPVQTTGSSTTDIMSQKAVTDALGTKANTSDIPTHKTAASGGTDLSVVTTGEMFTWNNKQDAIVFQGNYDATSNKAATMNDVPSIGTIAGTAFDGADGATAKAETDFLTGVNTLTYNGTALSTGIPTDKRILVLTVTSTTVLSLDSNFPGLALGRELHIIVVASGVAAAINIPHDGSTWFNANDMEQNKQCQVASGKIGEINIINGGASDSPKYYIRYIGA